MNKALKFGALCALFCLLSSSPCPATTNRPTAITVGTAFQPFYDTNALAFKVRAGVGNREGVAINELVRELKAAGIWTNLYAFYPMVGGTSNSMSCNLISTNYSITWNGSAVFNKLGVTGAANEDLPTYGDTGLAPLTVGATNSFSLYAYYSTNADSGTLLGTANVSGTNVQDLNIIFNPTSYPGGHTSIGDGHSDNIVSFGTNGSGGNIIISSYLSGLFSMNDVAIATNTHYSKPFLSASNVYVLADNEGSAESTWNGNLRAAGIGKGFTPTQASNLFAIVNHFQNSLRRKTP